jgi:hypothetical protein
MERGHIPTYLNISGNHNLRTSLALQFVLWRTFSGLAWGGKALSCTCVKTGVARPQA